MDIKNADIWFNCPGALDGYEASKNKKLTDSKLYEVIHDCIHNSKTLKENEPSIPLTKEDIDSVNVFVSYCINLIKEKKADSYYAAGEYKSVTNAQPFICDFWIVYDNVLEVHSFDNNHGVVDNYDYHIGLKLETLSLLPVKWLKVYKTIKTVKHRPKITHTPVVIEHDWDKQSESINKYLDLITLDNLRCKKLGFYCRYCQHCKAGTCEELNNSASKEMIKDDALIVDPEAVQIGKILKFKNLIKPWLDGLEKRALEMINTGIDIPDFKPVYSSGGSRVWTDKEEALKLMESVKIKKDDRYSKSIATVKSIEALLKDSPRKWNRFKELIKKPTRREILVPLEDPRKDTRTIKEDI